MVLRDQDVLPLGDSHKNAQLLKGHIGLLFHDTRVFPFLRRVDGRSENRSIKQIILTLNIYWQE